MGVIVRSGRDLPGLGCGVVPAVVGGARTVACQRGEAARRMADLLQAVRRSLHGLASGRHIPRANLTDHG